MIQEEFDNLKPGDIVRGKSSGSAYVVAQHHGDHVTIVRTMDISNPPEWDLIPKPAEQCSWNCTEELLWQADCGGVWQFEDGGPEENNAKYCPFCGKVINPVRYADLDD
jgi:hypothetical protein